MKKLLLIIALIASEVCYSQCKDIKKDVDKFTGKITYKSPFDFPVRYLKGIDGADTVMFLILECKGATLNVKEKGVIILFDDGSKLNLPEIEIKSRVGDPDWEYSAWIPINGENINDFKDKKIESFRLYIYDRDLSKKEKEKCFDFFNCILKSW